MMRNKKRAISNFFILLVLVAGISWVCGKFIHLGNVEYTDNAQVKQHLTPVSTRVQGFIKKICFEEKEMEGFTFQNVERDSGVIRIAEEYVTNWQKMKQNHMGYLFWGPVGTGKSYLAACIANALLEKEVTVKMTNFNTILNDLFAAEDKTEYIRSLNGYELLIIDDLGVERSSEYALENIFSVIDWRYRSGKPLIITTNLPLAQLKQETKIEKKRIYDRILERCIPVKIDGVSRREAMANDNMQTMKNILKI